MHEVYERISPEVKESEIPFSRQDESQIRVISEFPEYVIASIAKEINRNGFAMIPGYLISGIEQLKSFVVQAVDGNGGEYTCFTGADELTETPFGKIAVLPEFQLLLHRIYNYATPGEIPKQSIYQVLRCLKGESGRAHSLKFHYDSYVVTALLPIHIPVEGKTGDLVMLQNRRGIRVNYFANVIDKLMLDNRATQFLLRRMHQSVRTPFRRVKMVPGNLYLFWGYQTVHANEPCDINQLRATALFHFGDPHFNSVLRRFMGKASVRAVAQ